MDLGSLGAASTLALVVSGGAMYILRSVAREETASLKRDVVRLDGRINTHERECGQRQEKLDERHQTLKAAIEDVHEDVQQVSGKIDRLLTARFGQ